MPNNTPRVIYTDHLMIVWRFPDGKIRRQGKRVSSSCPISRATRAAYVRHGTCVAVALIMGEKNLSLAEAWRLLKLVRGVEQARWS